ncbi:MAG: pyridoxal phosphate-dependent aminotransferase [candidate division KSB1 bacterium]|nr:pyridoxal phosphate-dependent aminotransferase [candidate division KSB1 bacterium]MDQ7063824.1 pyridoxal phosphate-dependent aminotransferase [candidate division KSB1 bacterium]
MHIPSKLPDVGTTIFAVMTRLANEHGAINLSQGFPDFDCDPELIDHVHHYMRKGMNQYAPMQGILPLRERLVEKIATLYGATYDPDTEICITSGATEALFEAITAVVHPGDEVIVFEPAYDSYVPAIRLSGGQPVSIAMQPPDYRIPWDAVAQAISDRTRLIILNSPHNPTGAVLLEEDIEQLRRLVHGTDIVLLSDEVYEHIIFDGEPHRSLCRYPDLAERSFVVSSFGKTYHATGWKLGYCVAPLELMQEFQRVHQFVTFCSNTPVQYAYADYLAKKEKYLELPAFYQQKRDRFQELLRESRFRIVPCRGTYFQLLDYSEISDEPDMEFARRLTIEHGIAAIPPSVFYDRKNDYKVLRFCFAKTDETLERAAETLCKI